MGKVKERDEPPPLVLSVLYLIDFGKDIGILKRERTMDKISHRGFPDLGLHFTDDHRTGWNFRGFLDTCFFEEQAFVIAACNFFQI